MRRIIKDYSTITDEHKRLIQTQYPKGFSGHDLVELKTAGGGHIDVLELFTDEAVYLLKIDPLQLDSIEIFEEIIPEEGTEIAD